jgi:hypothetical protein
MVSAKPLKVGQVMVVAALNVVDVGCPVLAFRDLADTAAPLQHGLATFGPIAR